MEDITDSMDLILDKLRETVRDGGPGVPQFIELQRVRYNLATEQQEQGIRRYRNVAVHRLEEPSPLSVVASSS